MPATVNNKYNNNIALSDPVCDWLTVSTDGHRWLEQGSKTSKSRSAVCRLFDAVGTCWVHVNWEDFKFNVIKAIIFNLFTKLAHSPQTYNLVIFFSAINLMPVIKPRVERYYHTTNGYHEHADSHSQQLFEDQTNNCSEWEMTLRHAAQCKQ